MKLTDNWPTSFADFVQDFREGIQVQREAIDFIKLHQLWKGFWNYGWVSKLLTLMGIVLGAKLFSIFNNWWNHSHLDSVGATMQSMFSLVSNVFVEGSDFLFASSFKYFIFIFMEILIFHFLRRTMELQTGKEIHSGFNAFVKAEVRMIKVVLMVWIIELLVTVAISIIFGMFGLSFLQWPVLVVVQCYFLGFIVIDNYNELYGMGLKLSEHHTRQYAGVALALGLTTYLMLLIPIIGPVVAPFIAGVSAAIIMHRKRGEDGLPADNLLAEGEFV